MQVILLEDVPNVGKKYEEHEVADGYGTNYLLPNGLAQVANERTRAKYEQKRKEAEKQRQKRKEEKAQTLSNLEDMEVTIRAEAGDQGQLFAGVHSEDIAEAVNNETDTDTGIVAEDIAREQPIQKVGEYDIILEVLDETAEITVVVEGK